MDSLMEKSPLGVFIEHIKKGELAYQVCTDDNKAIFFPRVVAPKTGSTNLEWRVSKGLGTVYTTTVVCGKENAKWNVAMIDVDGLKGVNDTFGHLVGDRMLLVVAQTAKGQVRGADVLARYGGDEFVLMLPCLLYTSDAADE